MLRRFLALLFASSLLLAAPAAASAASSVDQAQEKTGPDFTTTLSVAQTFTAGVTGSVDRVELYSLSGGTFYTVEIYDIVDGKPGSALGPGANGMTASNAWSLSTFAGPAHVVAGTQYAIVIKHAGQLDLDGTSDATSYTRGGLFFEDGTWKPVAEYAPIWVLTDLVFRTYVNPDPDLNFELEFSTNEPPAGVDSPMTLTVTVTNRGIAATDDEVFVSSDGTEIPFHVLDVQCSPTALCSQEDPIVNVGVMQPGDTARWVFTGVFLGSEVSPGDKFGVNGLACIGDDMFKNVERERAQAVVRQGDCFLNEASVTASSPDPKIAVTQHLKSALPAGGGSATFVIAVQASGNVPLSNVAVTDADCTSLSQPVKTGGNTDTSLEPWGPETWTYECTRNVTQSMTNHVQAQGVFGEQTVSATSALDVPVQPAAPNPTASPVATATPTPHPNVTPPPTTSTGHGSDGSPLPIVAMLLLGSASAFAFAFRTRRERM